MFENYIRFYKFMLYKLRSLLLFHSILIQAQIKIKTNTKKLNQLIKQELIASQLKLQISGIKNREMKTKNGQVRIVNAEKEKVRERTMSCTDGEALIDQRHHFLRFATFFLALSRISVQRGERERDSLSNYMYKYKYKKVVLEGRDISVRRGGREGIFYWF